MTAQICVQIFVVSVIVPLNLISWPKFKLTSVFLHVNTQKCGYMEMFCNDFPSRLSGYYGQAFIVNWSLEGMSQEHIFGS